MPGGIHAKEAKYNKKKISVPKPDIPPFQPGIEPTIIDNLQDDTLYRIENLLMSRKNL